MKSYNVRLEFDPVEHIGTILLQPGLKAGHEIEICEPASFGAAPKIILSTRIEEEAIRSHRFVLDIYQDRGVFEVAVRSDKPVEFWRRVPGFTERKKP